MLERKNIDRVFQENLKDLEIYPNKRVWNNIEGSLNGKTSRAPIALWKRLSGIAVMLAAIDDVLTTNAHKIGIWILGVPAL